MTKTKAASSEDFVLNDISSTLDVNPNKSEYVQLVESLALAANGRRESDIPVGEDYWKIKSEVMASSESRKG